MLIVAAAIQAVVAVLEAKGTPKFSDFADVFVILVVVIINTIMSLVQESKAEAAMDALMEMTAVNPSRKSSPAISIFDFSICLEIA